ncbi:MAG: hypothetical protein WCO42_07275 [bacterium]
MSFKRCPGSMSFTQPKIELVRCPHCGEDAEVWSDEADGKCSKCGHTVCRTATQSCIDWCKYAKECLGDEEHKRYQDLKTRLRKETLLKAGEAYLMDEQQKSHARDRAAFAEQILSRESAADPNVVIAASVLLAVNRTVPAGGDQAVASASLVSDILHELGYPEGFIKEVSGIVTCLHEFGDSESLNFRIVHDAELLASGKAGARLLTDAGKALASKIKP